MSLGNHFLVELDKAVYGALSERQRKKALLLWYMYVHVYTVEPLYEDTAEIRTPL